MATIESVGTKRLSGIVINQNQSPSNLEGVPDRLSLADWKVQEFRLPQNFERGTDPEEMKLPSLTGFQFFVRVEAGKERVATIDWILESRSFGVEWGTLVSGSTTGVHAAGEEVWFDVYFDEPVDPGSVNNLFRFWVRGRTGSGPLEVPVEYNDGEGYAIIDDTRYNVKLIPDVAHRFDWDGTPSLLFWDKVSGNVTYSVQQGVTDIWYSLPNPLDYRGVDTYESDGTTVILDPESGDHITLMFRLLAATADSGTDFLGNSYRSVAVANDVKNLAPGTDSHWLSKPNPSKFAVETLYFDMRDENGDPTVVDRLLLDPITPGMWFHLYYCNDGDPGIDDYTWENKVWTPVTQNFQAIKRQTHVLPTPITAKYLCIEFSHLQAQAYSPSGQKPIRYKKHPKWVLDYFLLQTEALTEDHFIARNVTIVYDALDLAYNYYADDLNEDPTDPAVFQPNPFALQSFLTNRSDVSDKIDPATLQRIETRMKPWRDQPGLRGPLDYLMTTSVDATAVYPTEAGLLPTIQPVQVSTTDRDRVMFEQSYPVMYFFVDARHLYREVEAEFEYDRAYFAGVREIAFLRDRYSVAQDTPLYLESAGDDINAWRNDFVRLDNGWTVYDPG